MPEYPYVFGPYAMVMDLGEGGMGRVSLAWTESLPAIGPAGGLCVIKELNRTAKADRQLQARFLDEARLSMRLVHPKIVKTFSAGRIDGEPYLAQEFVDGEDVDTLRRQCERDGVALPVRVALFIAREIAAALAYAHALDGLAIVHRDISPSNIRIGFDGRVKLLDFGAALWTQREVETSTGDNLVGKASYVAPEQIREEAVDARADIYALGSVLWELLTLKPMGTMFLDGHPRMGVHTANDAVQFTLSAVPPAPSAFNSRCSLQVDRVVAKALAKRREDRFSSADELKQALDALLEDGPDRASALASLMRLFPTELQHRQRDQRIAQARALLVDGARHTEGARGHSLPVCTPKTSVSGELGGPAAVIVERPLTVRAVEASNQPSEEAVKVPTLPAEPPPASHRTPVPDLRFSPRTEGLGAHAGGVGFSTTKIHSIFSQRLVLGGVSATLALLLGTGLWVVLKPSLVAAPSVAKTPIEPTPTTVARSDSAPVPPPAAFHPEAGRLPEAAAPVAELPPTAPVARVGRVRPLQARRTAAPVAVPSAGPSSPEDSAGEAIAQAEDALYARADLDEAVAAGKRAVKAGGGARAHAVLADAYLHKGMIKQARSEYEEALRLSPDDPRLRSRLARIEEQESRAP